MAAKIPVRSFPALTRVRLILESIWIFTSAVEETTSCWVVSDVSKDFPERRTAAVKNLRIQHHESLVTISDAPHVLGIRVETYICLPAGIQLIPSECD